MKYLFSARKKEIVIRFTRIKTVITATTFPTFHHVIEKKAENSCAALLRYLYQLATDWNQSCINPAGGYVLVKVLGKTEKL